MARQVPKKFESVDWVQSLTRSKRNALSRARDAEQTLQSPTRAVAEVGILGGAAAFGAGVMDQTLPEIGPVKPSLAAALMGLGAGWAIGNVQVVTGSLSVVNCHVYGAGQTAGKQLQARFAKDDS